MKLFNVIDTTFENFDNTVKTYLNKVFNNNGIQYSRSQIFNVIFDGVKGVMSNILFYIEDALNEQNIFTAIRKKSIYSLAKISGYNPYYGCSSTGKLIGTLHIANLLASKTNKVYIYNHSQVINNTTGLTYSIILPTNYYVFDISQPLTMHEFKIVQGTFKTSSYVAKGLELEAVHVNISGLIDNEYIEVRVNNELYNMVENLYDMTSDSHEYVYQTGYDNTFDIIFGDGDYGHRLQEGDTITISYLTHVGELGDVLPNDVSEFKFNSYGYDALGNSVNINDYMNLKIDTCVSGGNNANSINFIKQMVGKNSRSLVFASEDSFKLFFKRFSFIGYANCWASSNSMIIYATCIRNIKKEINNYIDYIDTSKFPDESFLLTNDQKTMIQNTLNNSKRVFAGISLKFIDPIIRKYAFICFVKIEDVYNKDSVKLDIKQYLCKYFLELEDDTIFIAKSDIVKYLVDNIPEIKSIEMEIISEMNERAFVTGQYDTYEEKYNSGQYEVKLVNYAYESDVRPGLDEIGNISLSSKLEIPLLRGGFKYYPNKEISNIATNQLDNIQINDPIQINFI